MRILLLVLALLLAGCSAGNDSEAPTDDAKAPEAPDAGEAVEDCVSRCGVSLSHPNETIEIRESGPATDGYDEEFFWSVHPGSTESSIFVELRGPQDAGAAMGAWGYEVQGPGYEESTPCPGSGTIGSNVSVGSRIVLVDQSALDVGNWRLRVCLAQSVAEYNIEVDVKY